MELFVPGFEGERKRSARPATPVLTAGTLRACIHDLRLRDHFLNDQLRPTPHLYFLYFLCFEMPSGDRDLIPPAKIARFAKALMIGAESGAR
jgi:hypothetical protein